ncbi:sel1 repeat family protein [Pseudomonas sp. MF6772]|uniref:sel1 repeat family protein n=1 Tax=Pseudomonas TaxID=286 RepID=UPI0015E3BA95|nr:MULTISPECIES: sel1 repeat family protein [Pseudomonas]MBA1192967.1 sel1 repeat family protein [Pseudomonas entomophila]MBJ2266969.1 sel1 repeat family protein [Pseudomonas sp. MF6772]MBS7842748.1 sel1 repeat family protein [Pseudomonas fluorescens]
MNYGVIRELNDIQRIFEECGPEKAGEIIRKQALDGNLLCQVFLSGAGLQISEEMRSDSIKNDIEVFTKMAAENGDVGSQFNLALFYIKRVNLTQEYFSDKDVQNLREAKRWHYQAASQGFSPSIKSIKNLKSIFDLI